jgi:collagenase-like PrtC family protease
MFNRAGNHCVSAFGAACVMTSTRCGLQAKINEEREARTRPSSNPRSAYAFVPGNCNCDADQTGGYGNEPALLLIRAIGSKG